MGSSSDWRWSGITLVSSHWVMEWSDIALALLELTHSTGPSIYTTSAVFCTKLNANLFRIHTIHGLMNCYHAMRFRLFVFIHSSALSDLWIRLDTIVYLLTVSFFCIYFSRLSFLKMLISDSTHTLQTESRSVISTTSSSTESVSLLQMNLSILIYSLEIGPWSLISLCFMGHDGDGHVRLSSLLSWLIYHASLANI